MSSPERGLRVRRMKPNCGRGVRIALAVLAGVAVASLVANGYLASALFDSFRKLQYERIFPLGDLPAPQFAASGRCVGRAMAFYGDSRALMWETEGLPPKLPVVNFGRGGLTSNQLLALLKSEPQPSVAAAVLQIGINDLHPLGALGADKPRILAALTHNVREIRDVLLSHAGVVVLTTVFPTDAVPLMRRPFWDPRTEDFLRDLNEVIRGSAIPQRVVVLDAYSILAGRDGRLAAQFVNRDFFLHVSPAAYVELNRALRRLVELEPLLSVDCEPAPATKR